MVYQSHIAAGMLLLALVAGTWMLVRVCHQEICCRWLAKTVGIFVVAVSLLLLACNGYHTYTFWKTGEGKVAGMGMHGARMMGGMGLQQMPRPPRPPMPRPAPMPGQPGMGPGMMPGGMSMGQPGQGMAPAPGKGCPMMDAMGGEGKAEAPARPKKPSKPQAK